MKASGRTSLLVDFYRWKIEKDKERLKRLPIEKAAVELDFRSLDLAPKVDEHILYLNPIDEGLSAQLYAWRFREPVNTHFLSTFISDEKQNIDAVIDIGSNIGYFPLVEIVSGAPQVIAIEPVPETYFFLKKNSERFENIKLLNVAVSHKKEILKMHVPTKRNLARVLNNTINFEITEPFIKEIVDVQALPLENVLKTENLMDMNVLIRMDIEGYEKNIVNKLPEEVYGLSFELHSSVLGYHTATALIKKLGELGYRIQLMTRELGGLTPIIKFLGVRKALRLYESLVEGRVFYKPSNEVVKEAIRKQRENPHIFAVRNR